MASAVSSKAITATCLMPNSARLCDRSGDRHQLYGDIIGPKNVLFTEGDSITAGVGASVPANCYAQLLATTPNPAVLRLNSAVSGTGLGMPSDPPGTGSAYARLPALLARIAEVKRTACPARSSAS